MKWLSLLALLLPGSLFAQDARSFARALEHHHTRAVDLWMARELHRHRKGVVITIPTASYTVHYPTYDSLVVWLRRQPGVVDAEWDRCVVKTLIWPGHSTIGLRLQMAGAIHERCYTLQEGRPGTINVFGWRPRVRKTREDLELQRIQECEGFVEAQRRNCAEQVGK